MMRDSVVSRFVRMWHTNRGVAGFAGNSPAILECLDLITRVAETDVPVLFLGEKGVGKQFFARYLHQLSPRRERPCLAVSGAKMLDGEVLRLFYGNGGVGGVLEEAEGGSLFFDDMAEMPVEVQKELYAFLDKTNMAGTKNKPRSGVRILTSISTVKDASARVLLEGLLNIIGEAQIRVPALRERREDILGIARQALEQANIETGKHVHDFSPGAMDFLDNYDFPGNIEELLHLVYRAVGRTRDDVVYREDFALDELTDGGVGVLPSTLEEMERRHINAILVHTGWNRRAAAHLLGLPESTLLRKIKLHGLADVFRKDGR